jgi:hypothetical protein
MHPRSVPAFLVIVSVAMGCGDDKSAAPSASAAPPAPVSAAPSTSAAPSGMTPKAFCAAVKKRVGDLYATCETGPAFDDLRKMMKLTLESDLCENRLEHVVIDEAKAAACLDEVKTYWDADIVHLQYRPSCRAAMKGTAGDGGSCFFTLECPPGTDCVSPLVGEEFHKTTCSPKIEVGTPCRNGAGESCGKEFECVKGACAARPKLGEACKENCGPGLRCLRNRSTDAMGKCGPARKAGEACHRWTECEGACDTPKPEIKDGKCASFCGSP